MKDMRPLLFVALSLACPSAHAQSSDHAKILDIQSATVAGTPSAIDAGGVPIVIPSSSRLFTVTVKIDDIAYSAEFRDSRKVHSRDFIVGDSTKVTIDRDKMLLISPAGKEVKGRLVRRQRLPPPGGLASASQ